MRRLALALALIAVAARSQVDETTPGWFAFDMPGLDAATGTPVDLSALNAEPAGKHGFLRGGGGGATGGGWARRTRGR